MSGDVCGPYRFGVCVWTLSPEQGCLCGRMRYARVCVWTCEVCKGVCEEVCGMDRMRYGPYEVWTLSRVRRYEVWTV